MSVTRTQVQAFEDSGVFLMARILGNDGSAIQQADISSISYTVYTDGGTEVTSSTSLTVANVVFDTLQTDSRWTVDGTGYNFGFELPAASLPDGNVSYHVEVKFTPNSGEAWHASWVVTTLDLKRS